MNLWGSFQYLDALWVFLYELKKMSTFIPFHSLQAFTIENYYIVIEKWSSNETDSE